MSISYHKDQQYKVGAQFKMLLVVTFQNLFLNSMFNLLIVKSYFLSIVGVVLWFGIVFILAEITRRLFLFAEEIKHLNTRYNGAKSRLFLYVFSSPYAANLTALIMLLSLLFVSILNLFKHI